MGKSDNYIFPEYLKVLCNLPQPRSVAFLGFSRENELTARIPCKNRDFFDLSLNNWEINSDWHLPRSYDLIVSTRCPYFSKDPIDFVNRCRNSLEDNGHALIDWGLGDHWRFGNYKVGWIRNGEHEFAYHKDNYLYSCFWNEQVSSHKETKDFWNCVVSGNFGYNKFELLQEVVVREVPSVVSYETKKLSVKFLWPDSPQLYVITLIEK